MGPIRPRVIGVDMGGNPYRLADRRQRIARIRSEGPLARLAGIAPFLAAIAAVWLARDVYATLLGGTTLLRIEGYSSLISRIGLTLAALLSLSTYDTVVRGPDRGVIDLHPLHAGAWLRARVLLLARERASWVGVASIFLLPVLPDYTAFALGVFVLLGAWTAGIGAGLGVNLAAPGLSGRPELAGVLDAIRGHNPRRQAALLYAPGVALALSGGVTLAAVWGATRVLVGDLTGLIGLIAPFLGGALGIALAAIAAPSMAGIGAVLGEIEAAWASAETSEDAHAAYLEWMVRLAPRRLRLGLQKDLRHLWRGHRSWITASWGLALLCAIAGWTDAPDGAARLTQVGAACLAAFGFVGVRLGAADPAWLDAFLPLPGRLPARALALFSAMQVVFLPGVATLAIRAGVAAGPPLLRLELVALALAAVAAWAGDALRAKGGLAYLPMALLVWAIGGVA